MADHKQNEKREWTKPSVAHKTNLERVKAGLLTAPKPETPVYIPS